MWGRGSCSLQRLARRSRTRQHNWRLTSTPRRRKRNKHILLTTNNLLKRRISQHLNLRGLLLRPPRFHPGLIGNPSTQTLQVPTTLIILRLITLTIEPFQRRKTLDPEPTAQFAVLVRIDFTNGDLVGGESEGLAELFIDRGEGLAMTAPGGEEFDEGGFAGLQDDAVEVFGVEVDDGGIGEGQAHEGEAAHEEHT